VSDPSPVVAGLWAAPCPRDPALRPPGDDRSCRYTSGCLSPPDPSHVRRAAEEPGPGLPPSELASPGTEAACGRWGGQGRDAAGGEKASGARGADAGAPPDSWDKTSGRECPTAFLRVPGERGPCGRDLSLQASHPLAVGAGTPTLCLGSRTAPCPSLPAEP
jgi:hypothetical protein